MVSGQWVQPDDLFHARHVRLLAVFPFNPRHPPTPEANPVAPGAPRRPLHTDHVHGRQPGNTGTGSLRDAFAQANAPGADTMCSLVPRPGTLGLSPSQPGGHHHARAQPAGPAALIVTSPITIQGTGETITRSGSTPSPVPGNGGGNLTLQKPDPLQRPGSGRSRRETGGGGAAGLGGAIYTRARSRSSAAQ